MTTAELRALDAKVAAAMGLHYEFPNAMKESLRLPRYSTDIVAAWTFLKWLLSEKGLQASIKMQDAQQAHTAPLAICLAGLAVCGVEA